MIIGIAQNIELHIKQFFKLQSHLSTLQLIVVMWIMHPSHSFIARSEMQGIGNKGRKRLGERSLHLFEQSLCEFFHSSRSDASLLHSFGSAVVRLHAHLGKFQFSDLVYIRMCNLKPTTIHARFAKHDIIHPHFIGIKNIFSPLKPNQVGHVPPIREVCYEAFSARSHIEFLKT